jgi:hypothetical protein
MNTHATRIRQFACSVAVTIGIAAAFLAPSLTMVIAGG